MPAGSSAVLNILPAAPSGSCHSEEGPRQLTSQTAGLELKTSKIPSVMPKLPVDLVARKG